MSVYLDLHLSDTWADPGHQAMPSGWKDDNIGDLTWTVYNYTMQVANEFASASISPTIVSIGNEINNGLLWPLAGTSSWYNIASLLHPVAWGIKGPNLDSKLQILIHLADGWSCSEISYSFENALGAVPLDFDMIGLSYYPFYNSAAALASLKSSLHTAHSTYGKPLAVTETDWPISPSDTKSIPFSASGQTTWMQDLAVELNSVSGAVGLRNQGGRVMAV